MAVESNKGKCADALCLHILTETVFVLSSVHTTRVHGRVDGTRPVNMGVQNDACVHVDTARRHGYFSLT